MRLTVRTLLAVLLAAVVVTSARRASWAADERPQGEPAADPAPVPATRPTRLKPAERAAKADAENKQALADLTSRDPDVRDAAVATLKGMSRQGLTSFEKIVRTSLPLAPSQLAVLREVVTHAYLASEPYEATGKGFLGINLGPAVVYSSPPDQPIKVEAVPPPARAARGRIDLDDEPNPRGPPIYGIVIIKVFPGFCGARAFRPGDVLLDVIPDEGRTLPLQSGDTLIGVVAGAGVGGELEFEVLRQGRVTRVAVTLDAKPLELDTTPFANTQGFVARRQAEADAYWETAFVPLLARGGR